MKLFEPITIRGMKLKNRIVFPPMQVNVGFRSQRAQAYYAERARGGAGNIADTIVIAAGSNSEKSLLGTLQAKGLMVYPIGDCASPRRIADAMRDGAQIGGEI